MICLNQKFLIITVLAISAPIVYGSGFQRLKPVSEAVKLAESVPFEIPTMTIKTVAHKIKSAGLTITGATKYSYDSKAELEQPGDKVGDLHFTIHTSQPTPEFKRTICDMWGDADFLKRDGKFYAENRSANWLLKGECSTKFVKPQ